MFNRFNVLTYIAENFKIWFRPIILTTAIVIILLFWNKKNNNNTIVLKQYAKKKTIERGYELDTNTYRTLEKEKICGVSLDFKMFISPIWNYYPFIRKNLPFKMILKKRDYLFYISFTTTMKRFFGKEWNKAAGKKWLYKNLGNI